MSLRDLLTKVDVIQPLLPPDTQNEVCTYIYIYNSTSLQCVMSTPLKISMANKVLSSDVARLVEAMKDAQKNYQSFVEPVYQKQMLQAGHIIAVNAKQLLDTVNNARRKVLKKPR